MTRAPGRLAVLMAKAGPKKDDGADDGDPCVQAAQGVIDALDAKDADALDSALSDYLDAHADKKSGSDDYDGDES